MTNNQHGQVPAQAAPAAVAGQSETVKFVDESTADPVEKARRYLKAMGDPRMNSAYFFDDGYPRREISQGALATLAVLEQLAAAPAAQRGVFDEAGFRAWVIRSLPDNTIIGNSTWWADYLAARVQRFMSATPQPSPTAQADSVLEDAARYRYLRDGDWREHEALESVIRLQLNTLWDAKIDAAMKEGGAA